MDTLKITILENGTVKIETDAISGPNHLNAEKALEWISKELGGTVERTRRIDIHKHIHAHEHEHEDGTIHSH